jgi:hypothetical protein
VKHNKDKLVTGAIVNDRIILLLSRLPRCHSAAQFNRMIHPSESGIETSPPNATLKLMARTSTSVRKVNPSNVLLVIPTWDHAHQYYPCVT